MPEKTLLYVEDEKTDIMLLQLALKSAQIRNPLKTVTNGEAAIAYLKGDGVYADREQYPLPGLVLLDLNLPRRTGMQVLQWIRGQPQLADLPVVIYTSSGQPRDQEQALQFGANEYVEKSSRIEKIAETVQKLLERWLGYS